MPRNWKMPSPSFAVACTSLVVALATAGYAANTIGSVDIIDDSIRSEDIGDREVGTIDIAEAAITATQLANDAVSSGDVADESLTSDDLKGADVSRVINIAAGLVANGRCKDFNVVAAGAAVGDVVALSLLAFVHAGMQFTSVRVKAANQVTIKVCNLTGAPSPGITNLPIRVMTFG